MSLLRNISASASGTFSNQLLFGTRWAGGRGICLEDIMPCPALFCVYLRLCVYRKIQSLIACLACSPLISKRDIPKPWLGSLISHKNHSLTAGTQN